MKKHIFFTLHDFIKKIGRDNVTAFSAQASFFIILSFFPFLMLLLTIIQYTPIEKEFLIEWTTKVTPDVIDPLMKEISNELYIRSGGIAFISLSAILALWSASRGVLAIIRGLNSVYQTTEKRNYFLIRLFACIYTIIFLIAILMTLGLLVFGQSIYQSIQNETTFFYQLLHSFMQQKWIFSITFLTLFFLVIYRFLPAKKNSLLTNLPGAFICSCGWIISSSFLSIYIRRSPSFSYTYGSLTTFIVFMLWMYVGMYFLLFGAEFNLYFQIRYHNFIKKIRKKNNA